MEIKLISKQLTLNATKRRKFKQGFFIKNLLKKQ